MAQMKMREISSKQIALMLGDVLALAIVTLFGFASHGTVGTAGARMLTTFLPLVAAWFFAASISGAFDMDSVSDPRQLWKPFLTMILAAPFAAWLRGVMLNAPVLPLFVLVLGGFGALGILLWRSLFWLLTMRKSYQNG
jgi:hypothetical protein